MNFIADCVNHRKNQRDGKIKSVKIKHYTACNRKSQSCKLTEMSNFSERIMGYKTKSGEINKNIIKRQARSR